MPNNYLIFATGRGRSYGYMLNCDPEEVTARCHLTLQAGFEIFVYEISPSPLGKNGFDPTGATPLKRVWHLYNAHDEFRDDAKSIINRLDGHSVEASKEYLTLMISEFQRELDVLKGGQHGKAEMVSGTQESVRTEESPKSGVGDSGRGTQDYTQPTADTDTSS